VLELDSGEAVPESNAILVHLARGTRFLPEEPASQARVLGWLFFEQNLVEPNLGTGRFWRLTGRDAGREQLVARFAEAGAAALGVLERHLDGREWLVGEAPTVADLGLYAYVHLAPEAGVWLEERRAVRGWLARVAALPGFVNDLEPYPPRAGAGAGGESVHG
jgi:glutathione S-transferase